MIFTNKNNNRRVCLHPFHQPTVNHRAAAFRFFGRLIALYIVTTASSYLSMCYMVQQWTKPEYNFFSYIVMYWVLIGYFLIVFALFMLWVFSSETLYVGWCEANGYDPY